jgi:hypothetical protein
VVTFVIWPIRGKEMDEQEPVVESDDNTSNSHAGTDSDGDEEHFGNDDEAMSE